MRNFFKKLANHLLLDEFAYLLITLTFLYITTTIKGITDNRTKLIYGLIIIIVVILYISLRILNYRQRKIEEENEKKKDEAHLIELAKSNTIFVQFKKNKLVNNKYVDQAYETSEEAVRNAHDRIVIVSDYSPAREDLEVTETRQNYYKAIEDVLQKKSLEKRDTPFKYIRYMQREPNKFLLISSNEGVIDKYDYISGDEQAFCHCKRVIEKFSNNNNIDLEFYVTINIPSIPSMLLIDKKKLLFTIPERKKGYKLETAGVLDFTDFSLDGKMLVEPFMKIVKTLPKDNGKEVVKIKSISNFNQSNWKKWMKT